MKSAVLSLLSVMVVVFQTPAQVPANLQIQFQQIIETSLTDPGVKGISACVILPDGSIWAGQAGVDGVGDPISDTTVFYGGSTTKTFLATRILQLWEDGLIALDSSYTQYMDSLEHVLPSTTIRQMLNHTSGIFDVDQHPDFFEDIMNDPFHSFTPAELVQQYLNQPHVFPPGTQYEYSNSNYIILGMVLEAITGNSVSEELRSNVFGAIPLNHTYFGGYEDFSEPHCGLWMFVDEVLTDFSSFPHQSLLTAAFSAGSIVSLPLDEARFIRELINGNILDAAGLAEMQSLNPFSNDYGLGLIGIELGQDTMVYGHNGGIGNLTDMFHAPELNLTVVVMQSSENGNAWTFNNLFFSAWAYILSTPEINDKPEAKLFPNPANDVIHISTGSFEEKQVDVFSAQGALIETLSSAESTFPLNISGFSPGIYYLIVRSGKKLSHVRFSKI